MMSYGQYDVIKHNVIHNWASFPGIFERLLPVVKTNITCFRALCKYSLNIDRTFKLFINSLFALITVTEIAELPLS